MYFNPSYMNPIAQIPMQQEFSQQPNQEPLEGIASLAPTQPTQPIPTQPSQPSTPANPTGDALVHSIQMQMMQQNVKTPAFNAYAKDVMDTGGYPTKTMQEYNTLFPNNLLTQNPLPVLDGKKSLPFDIAPITPYQQNENLDLTDRSGIMSEYSNYIQGGMGSRMHTADMRGGYSFMGEDMAPGSSTGFGDFRKFLDTFGIGDRLQFDDTGMYSAVGPNQSGIASLADYQSQQNTGPGI